MATALTFTVFTLGDSQLHQLHTSNGKMFVMGEVAVELFQESPTAFLQELRQGKYVKVISRDRDVLMTVADLALPVENTAGRLGITLLPVKTVESLLADKRRMELIQPFQLALLKLSSQEAARLMASGDYEAALPAALEAVRQGQVLFKPSPALQMFPLYLLAAQANLGLRRGPACEDFLALAAWLVLKEPALTTHVMRSQLSRLYGQLHAFQNKPPEALRSFAEDVYYCSLEYGAEDVRTSLGYYNLGKVLEGQGLVEQCMACNDQVVNIWGNVLKQVVLGSEDQALEKAEVGTTSGRQDVELPVGRLQLMEVVDMLQDILTFRCNTRGHEHESLGEVEMILSLAYLYLGDQTQASTHLELCQKQMGTGHRDEILNTIRLKVVSMAAQGE